MSINDNSIDISVIKGLVGDDEDVIKMFFNKFVDTVPENIEEIKLAIDDNDFIEVKAKAHKMKSSAKAVGANHLADICQKIETESEHNNQAILYNIYESLVNEFASCKKYIQSN